ncbi:MAG: hypothetical protein M3179_04730 [Actinomycetota bacterium]|nr:hypothetical protein [Actinomycetota bacterium]
MTTSDRQRDEKGAILVLAAVGVVMAMIAAALAIDLGFLAQEARRNQKVADLAALDAARVSPADYTVAALASASRNKFPTDPGYSLTAVEGIKVDGRCQAQPGAGTVCVTATSPHKNFFPFVGGLGSTSRAAMAGAPNAIGTVRVGSTVASADGSVSPTQDVLLDKTISALIGGNYSTDVIGWQGLASGSVTFAALTSALATATGNATFTAGTTDQVLQSTFTAAQLFTATADALSNSGNTADVSVASSVQNIGAQANGTSLNAPLKLYDLFNVGSVVVGNKQDVANVTLNVLELVTGGAILADGDHFATFDLTAANIVGGTIPGGFTGAKVSMGLIEAPQTSLPGPPGRDATNEYYTSAQTSQVRVKLEASFDIPLTNTITVVGVGSISSISVKVPYYLDLGRGHAYLERVNCGTSAEPTSVDVLGATDVGTSKLGTVSDADLRNKLVNPTPTTGVIGSALAGAVQVSITSTTGTTVPGNPGTLLTFTPPYTDDSPSQPVPGAAISLPALATTNTTATVLGVLNTGLLNDVISGVNASGLTFNSNTVGVNTSVLKPLYDALGMSFGGADVWAPPVQSCAALSQLGLPVPSAGPPVLRG